jgi:hypothetical protein
MRTNFLVIGRFSSRDWLETTYGGKIKKANDYATKGVPIAIVTEEHLWSFLAPKVIQMPPSHVPKPESQPREQGSIWSFLKGLFLIR